MFRKIILGYTYSPSLGDKLLAFEKELRKKLRWQIVAIFAILFALFSVCFVGIFSKNSVVSSSPIVKFESSKELELSSKIVFAEDFSSENSQVLIQLKATNTSEKNQITDFKFQTSDILEYGEILPQDSLIFDEKFGRWTEISLKPNQSEIRQFTVKIKEKIPSLGQNSKVENGYDCKISLFFGNKTSKKIKCPPAKSLEKLITATNFIDIHTTVSIFVVLIFVTTISAFRTNLLLKQIKSIKRK